MAEGWVRSSYCDNSACVEIAWRRPARCEQGACVAVAFVSSSRCDTGTCVEIGHTADEVLVRDSKDPDGPVLRFTPDEWDAFTAGVRAGEFDR